MERWAPIARSPPTAPEPRPRQENLYGVYTRPACPHGWMDGTVSRAPSPGPRHPHHAAGNTPAVGETFAFCELSWRACGEAPGEFRNNSGSEIACRSATLRLPDSSTPHGSEKRENAAEGVEASEACWTSLCLLTAPYQTLPLSVTISLPCSSNAHPSLPLSLGYAPNRCKVLGVHLIRHPHA